MLANVVDYVAAQDVWCAIPGAVFNSAIKERRVETRLALSLLLGHSYDAYLAWHSLASTRHGAPAGVVVPGLPLE